MSERYYSFNRYLRDRFGCRVQRIPVNLGLGCPNRDGTISTGGCIFCDYTGSGVMDASVPVEEQVRKGMEYARRRYKARKFFVYFQAFSNTYAPVSELKRLYEKAFVSDDIVGVIVGTRPDLVSDEVLELLASYKSRYEVWIELGLQSCHYETLKRINRGHTPSDFIYAVRVAKNSGLKVGAHVILGLPGEDREKMVETARFVSACGVDAVKIHALHVLEGTALEKMWRKGDFRLLEMDEYVELVVDFLEHLSPNIVVQRLTGEASPDRLIAPYWCLDKGAVLKRIRKRLEERDTCQGKSLSFSKCLSPARRQRI